MPEQNFYALGLDRGKQRINAITSNPGHALWTGIVEHSRARAVADCLVGPEMWSGWGIRTLSTAMAAYNPLGYHLGTVWPHDNSLIVAGLREYGFDTAACMVLTALFEAAQRFPYLRLPELFSGIPRTDYGLPIGYPVACPPQAWAAGAVPFILTQLLGLRPRDGGRVLEVVRPWLPAWLHRVRLRRLRVGNADVDLQFTRPDQSAGPASVSVDRTAGDVDVRVATE